MDQEARDEGSEESQRSGPDGEGRNLETHVAELEDALEHRQERIEELESRVVRLQADFQNYKKRAKARLEEAGERASEDLLKKFLNVRDDLERALDAEGDAESIREGIRITLDRFDHILESENVEPVDASAFDPERHEAIAQIPAPDLDEGDIVDVHRQGFERKGRVIRPARVTVAEKEE